MDIKLLDFSSLFQVALGMNLAVPFFSDAITRNVTPVQQTLQNLLDLQTLVASDRRAEFLGELAVVRRDLKNCEADIRWLADAVSLILIVFALISFAILYNSALDQTAKARWIADALLALCFIPPIGGLIILYFYSLKRSADIRIAMQNVYAGYIEAS